MEPRIYILRRIICHSTFFIFAKNVSTQCDPSFSLGGIVFAPPICHLKSPEYGLADEYHPMNKYAQIHCQADRDGWKTPLEATSNELGLSDHRMILILLDSWH